MKRNSIFFTLFTSLLALIVISSLSLPVMAQKSSDEMVEPVKNADYWFDKGALCATYGNDPAAIKFFQKVIALNPQRSGAYFEQGISYGQLGEFDKAIPLVNKAIEMEPKNGLFIYGRARVHLLAGDQEKAMADFKKAAELDDEDAQAYLETVDPAH